MDVWVYYEFYSLYNEVTVIVDMRVPGKRPRGRLRGRWMDCVGMDMQELRITPEDAHDRTLWKSRIRVYQPNSRLVSNDTVVTVIQLTSTPFL